MADGERVPGTVTGEGDDLHALLLSEFASILKVEPAAIDPTKSFDSYGLDSIDAVLASDRLGELLNRELAPEFLLQHRNLAAVVAALNGQRDETDVASLDAPIFLFDGGAGRGILLNRIVDHCPPDMEFVRVAFGSWQQWLGEALDFQQLTARICDDIERRSPFGPIILAGYSQGGLLAFAAAMELVARERRVDALVLFDTSIETLPAPPDPNHDPRRLLREPRLWGRLAMSAFDILLSRGRHPSRGFGTVRINLVTGAYRRAASKRQARRALLNMKRGWGRILFRGYGGRKLDHALQRLLFSELWEEWRVRASKDWRLSVPTYLLRAESPGEPDLGWRRFCTGFQVIPVAGGHGTMYDEENISALAAEFDGILRKVTAAGNGFTC